MKDINLLHPDLQPKARQFIALAKAKGIEVIITQTLRTQAEQDALYAQGRTAPGQIVTNLKYPASLHCWGVAFDIACLVNGKASWGPALYDLVGPLGESLGLTWGGRWANFVDRPHYQLKGYDAAALRLKYGTPERFMATWAKEVVSVPGFDGPAKIVDEETGKSIPGGVLGGRTYGELKTLADLLGREVAWDNITKTATIKKRG